MLELVVSEAWLSFGSSLASAAFLSLTLVLVELAHSGSSSLGQRRQAEHTMNWRPGFVGERAREFTVRAAKIAERDMVSLVQRGNLEQVLG